MRDFYIYGFKSRDEYDKKSARSYDDERRRIESWLGDHMSFTRTNEGKSVFISVDTRTSQHNPLYKAFKAKSFTDGDITLHFILFDMLDTPKKKLSLAEILSKIDGYLSPFDVPMVFDDSTVRKKLNEYADLGIIVTERSGKKILYRRADDIALPCIDDVLDFYSEIYPCGVVGSFLLDKYDDKNDLIYFKHHYITSAIDSEVLTDLFDAIRRKSVISVTNHSRNNSYTRRMRIIPLCIFISVQSGRQHLIAYVPELDQFKSFRIDYLSDVKIETSTQRFDEFRSELETKKQNMWGVAIKGKRRGKPDTEHVDFTIKVNKDEEYIVNRLYREKRIGNVEKIDDNTYRFYADVYDSTELIPWIRTFICRITKMNFSNRTVENCFKKDIDDMYRMYGIAEDGQ